MTISQLKTWQIQALVFLGLLLLVELGFRLAGHQPGVYNTGFKPVDKVVYQGRYWSDSLGINRYIQNLPKGYLPDSYIINKDGFRSEFDYLSHIVDSVAVARKSKKVMLVGDSYVEGCCSNPFGGAFADKLDREEGILSLNFGMGATDPVQYRLVVEHYVPQLRPDLVVVAVFLGNDGMTVPRPPRPGTPIVFPIKDCGWLASEKSYVFGSAVRGCFRDEEEAYIAILNKFTLWGEDVTNTQRICRRSALLSKIYYTINRPQLDDMETDEPPPYTYQELKQIHDFCKKQNIPLLFVGIPAPMDAINNVDLSEKYKHFFNKMEWHHPDTQDYSRKDYDGKTTGNHFNREGHAKFHLFLSGKVREALGVQ